MRCEHYFDVNNTYPGLWVRIATIYFSGRAASWLRSSRAHVRFPGWGEFCHVVSTKFDRDQHKLLIRQMDAIKQVGTVWEYYEKFDELMNQLLVYDPGVSMKYLTHRFTEGLHREIRNVVILQRPRDLESALVVASLQEEVLDSNTISGTKEFKKSDSNFQFKSNPTLKGALPLPFPPGRVMSGGGKELKNDDRKGTENSRIMAGNDKMSVLKAQRRAQGLCYICAEKWSPTHKCANFVQLHAVQELFALFQHQESELLAPEEQHEQESQLMAISLQAIQRIESAGTMRLLGSLQGKEVLILVDSGSSANFMSSKMADQQTGLQQLQSTVSVQVANGGVLSCRHEIPQCEWSTQGYLFCTSFKVLDLPGYDLILGMDWLSNHSPMQVDWANKLIILKWKGQWVTLQGVKLATASCKLLHLRVMREFQDRQAVAHLVQLCVISTGKEEIVPVGIQHILQQFASVFDEPSGLPPQRPYDHAIPLFPGFQLVNVRPYHYTPAQKDEIETQVSEMLTKGIIQPSSSPFSSPVLLVKKKDGSWRFCVDYRHLNAITVKNKYPLPIIDELLDELAGAQWFTKLDLRSGYHRIRMKVEDEHNITFKTHNGHFEFRVIPFGLTSAPATFQGAMNSILSSLMRRCVLVFVDDILIYSQTLEEHEAHLRAVFQILTRHQLKVKRSKCSFAQQRLAYLGHIISPNGVATDDKKFRQFVIGHLLNQ